MRKFYYYLLAVPVICLFFGTQVFAGETYSNYNSPVNPPYTFRYISSASLPWTNTDFAYNDGVAGDDETWVSLEWSFNNNLLLNESHLTKYMYGAISIECDLYIPNTNTRLWEWYSGVISGDPVITDTVKIYPMIKSTGNNHYLYNIIYVFDGYQPQTQMLPGPTMTLKNVRARWISTGVPDANYGVTVTGTCAQAYNSLRIEDTPLNRGLVSLIAEAFDNSDKLDLMLQYLYDIKMNDIQYYQQLTSDLSSILLQLQNANGTLISILNELDLDFNQVQTILDLFPSYRTQVLQYWQQMLAMNAQQSSEAAAIESQYQDKESVSASLADGLGDLNLPDVDMNDLDILSRVDQTQKTNFFGMLSIITNNSFITTLLLIICTGAIVGFILYGKKG